MGNSITFLGAAQTVTGSRHLIQVDNHKVLVDCGLFQGPRELKERNWEQWGFHPSELDAVIITHAHLDHIGLLPRLAKFGFSGPIYATHATMAIARITLPDSGRIQEEDARFANKHGTSTHHPAEPLYTEGDAYAVLKQFKPIPMFDMREQKGIGYWRFLPAGHILGSAFVELYFPNGERLLMSGDLGRYDVPILRDPETVEYAEYIVMESTYGDRLHSNEDPEARLEEIIKDAVQHGSAVLVPSFAVGRTQELLFHIRRLQDRNAIPRIPIFVDSPMATSATLIYGQEKEDYDHEMKLAYDEGQRPLTPDYLEFTRDSEQSKALNVRPGPFVVIAGSGMCTGGRIVHHLKQRLGDPNTIVLFTGYQAEQTLGRRLLEGAPEVMIHGQPVAVKARIEKLNSLSAHADQADMMRWLHGFKAAPKRMFLVHGEPKSQHVLADKIRSEFGWDVSIPNIGDRFEL